MTTDWSYLSYHLATMGIPSDVYEDIATNPEDDPWVPPDGAEIVLVAITKEDAGRLAAVVADRVASDIAGHDMERQRVTDQERTE